MPAWLVRNRLAWRHTQTAPGFAPAVVELTAAGECVLLAPGDAAITVNGLPLRTGIRLLQHRDEVAVVDGTIAYFSIEVLPEVVAFPGPAAKCGRCRSEIAAGTAAVKCSCGVWYHNSDPPCFEYGDDPVCVACHRPTRLDGSGLWIPEDAQ